MKNAHGDTVKLLRNGSLYDSAEYDPYGNYTDWNSYSSYGYANYYYDSYSGFYYLRNRFYDPSIGRFISEDSYWTVDNMIYGDEKSNDDSSTHINILDLITNSDKKYKSSVEIRIPDNASIVQSNNLYAYGMNNPIKYDDPNGNFALTATITAPSWVPWVVAGVTVVVTATVDGVIYLAKKSKSSGKEKGNDIPSWAKGEKPKPGESGKDFAKRLCDKKYGKDNYDKGPNSDYNKLKKYGDRGGKQ